MLKDHLPAWTAFIGVLALIGAAAFLLLRDEGPPFHEERGLLVAPRVPDDWRHVADGFSQLAEFDVEDGERWAKVFALLREAERRGILGEGQADQGVFLLSSGPSQFIGGVVDRNDSGLTIEVFKTGEHVSFTWDRGAVVRRGERSITLLDLIEGELVRVLAVPGAFQGEVHGYGVRMP